MKTWKTKEIETVISLYQQGVKVREIARILNRDYKNVVAKIWRLKRQNSNISHRNKSWSKNEEEELIKIYPHATKAELMFKFNRSYCAIRTKYGKLKRQN